MMRKAEREILDDYLAEKVFTGNKGKEILPDEKDVKGFNLFMEQYIKGIPIERAAVDTLIMER